MKNIFMNLPENLKDEVFESLFTSDIVRIERIISDGQSSSDGFWYDQDTNEWVIIMQGNSVLQYEDRIVNLGVGDYELIPAHTKHRVLSTSDSESTIWLAIHF